MRRYRCRSADCGWRGLFAVSRQPAAADDATLSWRKLRLGALPLALSGLAFALPIGLLLSQGLSPASPGARMAAGQSYDGDRLPPRHPLLVARPVSFSTAATSASAPRAAGLRLRQGCAWGQPGRNPYRGTPEQALTSARLPALVVERLLTKIHAHDTTDRIEISSAAIKAQNSERAYNPQSFAMTYGRTLCLNSRVNFAPGHVEQADLYEVTDEQGEKVAVMVPDVCGNVSVLGERGERDAVARYVAAAASAPRDDDPDSDVDGAQAHANGSAANAARSVPEPGTLACTFAALAVAAWIARRRR